MVGIVLAAGAGRRFGRPKGLVRDGAGRPWVSIAVAALRAGGCEEVVVVAGAAGDEVSAMVPRGSCGARVVRAERWAEGLSASLAAGLSCCVGLELSGGRSCPWTAAVVVPVDTPNLSSAEVHRVLAASSGAGLARATHAGRPGHPVLLGRSSWAAAAQISGDRGARALLRGRDVLLVECGDLSDGRDVDVDGSGGGTASS